jgi:hypothetical protein
VHYSLANSPNSLCEQQWVQSVRSLRRYNATASVWLFLFNGASEDLFHEAARWDVTIRHLGDYREYLERLHARGSVLCLYPTFHKFLVLADAAVEEAAQVLYLDCDTFFFSNVDRLFDRYQTCDLYAREEPMSRRSHYGYDPSYLDEKALACLATREGGRTIVPFNSGLCLLNNSFWNRLDLIRCSYLDLAWRLLSGQALFTDLHVPRIRSAALSAMNEIDRLRALPYPSANAWIIEQIALWLALGQIPEMSQGLISPDHVVQGIEFHALCPDHQCVVAHYYSRFQAKFFSSVLAILDQ